MTPERRRLAPEIVGQLLLDTSPWLSCDGCFHLMDRYVEALLGDTGHNLPAMRAHLAGCSACAEEAVSLLRLVADEDGVDPAPGLRRLGHESP
jgi:hypothetical protein